MTPMKIIFHSAPSAWPDSSPSRRNAVAANHSWLEVSLPSVAGSSQRPFRRYAVSWNRGLASWPVAGFGPNGRARFQLIGDAACQPRRGSSATIISGFIQGSDRIDYGHRESTIFSVDLLLPETSIPEAANSRARCGGGADRLARINATASPTFAVVKLLTLSDPGQCLGG